ncbi:hypothetical protein [Pseudomonas helmanticensis]|uniref:hypothetical protein n=1 Tax=Pseudomonas helmanticensis TaxID=1471381 RepID=UPI0024B650F5|nr:hypothetical protein [Pseudomonas helmanticensis]
MRLDHLRQKNNFKKNKNRNPALTFQLSIICLFLKDIFIDGNLITPDFDEIILDPTRLTGIFRLGIVPAAAKIVTTHCNVGSAGFTPESQWVKQ